jgi:1-acyl-sn-glycerol-3-phosphate acyltransferase
MDAADGAEESLVVPTDVTPVSGNGVVTPAGTGAILATLFTGLRFRTLSVFGALTGAALYVAGSLAHRERKGDAGVAVKVARAVVAVYGATAFATCVVAGFIGGALCRPFGHRWANRAKEMIVGRGLYYAMNLIGAWTVTFRGLDRIDGSEAFVLAPNHSSIADNAFLSFLQTASPTGEKKYLTKREYTRIPIFGWLQWLAGDIAVDTNTGGDRRASLAAQKASVERCKTALDEGSSIVIFPEGTRNKEPAKLLPFASGPFRIARDCGRRVLPVVLHGAEHAIGGIFNFGAAHVTVEVLAPLDPMEGNWKALRAECQGKMQAKLDDLNQGGADIELAVVCAWHEPCSPPPPQDSAHTRAGAPFLASSSDFGERGGISTLA